jgi:hypothetical protein
LKSGVFEAMGRSSIIVRQWNFVSNIVWFIKWLWGSSLFSVTQGIAVWVKGDCREGLFEDAMDSDGCGSAKVQLRG